MDNAFDTIAQAVREARAVDDAVDRQARILAELLEGRLEKVPAYILRRLKRKLQRFDAARGVWKC